MYIWSVCISNWCQSNVTLRFIGSVVHLWFGRVLHWVLTSYWYTHLLGFHINVHYPTYHFECLWIIWLMTKVVLWNLSCSVATAWQLLQLSLLCLWLCSPCDVRLVSLAARLVRSWWRNVACWSKRTRSWAGSCHRAASPSWKLNLPCRKSTARSSRAVKMVRDSFFFFFFVLLTHCGPKTQAVAHSYTVHGFCIIVWCLLPLWFRVVQSCSQLTLVRTVSWYEWLNILYEFLLMEF